MKSLLESLKLLRQDMELPEAQNRPVHAYYKAHLDALIQEYTPAIDAQPPLKKQGDPRRDFYGKKFAEVRRVEAFAAELLPCLVDEREALRTAVAEDLVNRAQGILARHLPPDGITADAAINELLALLDSPVANTLTSHLRD